MSVVGSERRFLAESEEDSDSNSCDTVLDGKIVEEEEDGYVAESEEEEDMSDLANFLSEWIETFGSNEDNVAAVKRQESVVEEDTSDKGNFLANMFEKYGDNVAAMIRVIRQKPSHSVLQFYGYKRKYRSNMCGREYFFPSLKKDIKKCCHVCNTRGFGREYLSPFLKKNTKRCSHVGYTRGFGPSRTVQLFYACKRKYSSCNSSSWWLIGKDESRHKGKKNKKKIVQKKKITLAAIPVRPSDDGSMFWPFVSHAMSRSGLYLCEWKKYYSSSSSDESEPPSVEKKTITALLSEEEHQWLVSEKKKYKSYKSINSDSDLYSLKTESPLPSGFYFSE